MNAPFSLLTAEGRRKYLNHAEYARFCESVKALPKRHRLFCFLVALGGMRISEALGVRGLHIASGEIVLRTLKRRKLTFRIVQLPEWLTDELAELVATDAPDARLWDVHRTTAWRWIKRAMRLSQIIGKHACPKGLRHGFGARCVLNNLPLGLIAKFMGHASTKSTQIYTDVVGPEERTLAARTWDWR